MIFRLLNSERRDIFALSCFKKPPVFFFATPTIYVSCFCNIIIQPFMAVVASDTCFRRSCPMSKNGDKISVSYGPGPPSTRLFLCETEWMWYEWNRSKIIVALAKIEHFWYFIPTMILNQKGKTKILNAFPPPHSQSSSSLLRKIILLLSWSLFVEWSATVGHFCRLAAPSSTWAHIA